MSPLLSGWIWIVVGLAAQGCCYLNNLADRPAEKPWMTVAVRVEEMPNVVFTGHRNMRTHGVPQGDRSHSEHQYQNVVESFDRQTVAHGLATGFTAARPDAAWWNPSGEEQEAELEFLILVEQTCFCADDPLMPVAVRWNLRVSVNELKSGQVIFQDCLDWTVLVEGYSMDQLERADPDQRLVALKGVLLGLGGRLAEHLAGQIGR